MKPMWEKKFIYSGDNGDIELQFLGTVCEYDIWYERTAEFDLPYKIVREHRKHWVDSKGNLAPTRHSPFTDDKKVLQAVLNFIKLFGASE